MGFSWQIAQFLLRLLGKLGLEPDPQQFHMGLRLFAHFGVFLITGVLFAGSLEVSLPGGEHKSIHVFLLGSSVCAFIAVAAEVGNLAVPGRHLTWSEAGLNVLGAVCGVLRYVSRFAFALCFPQSVINPNNSRMNLA